ncbi:MAG: hypothetical protein HY291_09865 [Planctomycetes bacterium]|nr:hypothetical protein [Planctomycetota bacterium]
MNRLRIVTAGVLLAACVLAAEDTALLKPVGGAGAGEVRDGLRVTLKAVKEEFGPGESLLMQCTLANVSEQEKTVNVVKNRMAMGQWDFKLELRRDGKDIALSPRVEKANPERVDRVIPPGGKVEFWLDLRTMHAEAKDREPFGEMNRYEASVTFTRGEVRSGWVVFHIAEAGRPHPKPRDAAEAEKIRSLIAQLGDDDFQKRENAEASLVQLGEAAVGILKEALEKQGDAEVKLRCKRVIEKIEALARQRGQAQPLCAECQNKAFTADIGQCANCHGGTPSGAWRFCSACAVRLGQCAACGKALNHLVPQPQPQPVPLPGPRPRPIRPLPPVPNPRPIRPLPPDPAPDDDF